MTICDTLDCDERSSELTHCRSERKDRKGEMESGALLNSTENYVKQPSDCKELSIASSKLVERHATSDLDSDYHATLLTSAKALDSNTGISADRNVLQRGLLALQTLLERSGEHLSANRISPATKLIEHGLLPDNDTDIVLQSLNCLKLLSHRNTKDLVAFWPQLFAPGGPLLLDHLGRTVSSETAETISVILQSGQKFWAMARESYSELLASMLNEIRSRCHLLLERDDVDMIPLLSLVHTLFVTTDHVPLRKSHTEIFRQCIIQCAQRSNTASEVVSVCDVLTLMESDERRLWPVAAKARDQLMSLLDEDSELSFPLLAHVWHTLALMYEKRFLKAANRLTLYISRDLRAESDKVRQSVAEMLSCIVAREGLGASDSDARHEFRNLVVQAAKDHSEMVRIAICGLWAKASDNLHANDSIVSSPLRDLLFDRQPKVRSSAIRSIGLCMERACADGDLKEIAAINRYYGTDVLTSILFMHGGTGLLGDANLNMRVCTAWTLANWTGLLTICPPTVSGGRRIISLLLPLPRAEQVAVHLVRALGNMLALGVRKRWFDLESTAASEAQAYGEPRMPAKSQAWIDPGRTADVVTEKPWKESSKGSTKIVQPSTQLDNNASTHLYIEGIMALNAVILRGRFAKVRWNAITSLVKAQRDAVRTDLCSSTLFWQGSILALCEALKDRILKIQRMAAEALVELIEQRQADIPSSVHVIIMECTQQAQSMLKERVRTASFGDAQIHGQACDQALEHLSRRLKRINSD